VLLDVARAMELILLLLLQGALFAAVDRGGTDSEERGKGDLARGPLIVDSAKLERRQSRWTPDWVGMRPARLVHSLEGCLPGKGGSVNS